MSGEVLEYIDQWAGPPHGPGAHYIESPQGNHFSCI